MRAQEEAPRQDCSPVAGAGEQTGNRLATRTKAVRPSVSVSNTGNVNVVDLSLKSDAKHKQNDAVREIPLRNGGVAIVDEADYDDLVRLTSWRSGGNDRYRYAYGGNEIGHISMHRWLTLAHATPERFVNVHHKNGNCLDNRRCNLEVLTPKEHSQAHVRMRRGEATP